MCFIPVYLCPPRRARPDANGCDTLQLAPPSSSKTSSQVIEPMDPTARRNRLDVRDVTDDFDAI